MNDQPSVANTVSQQPKFPGAWSLFKPSMHALGFNFWTLVQLILLPVIAIVAGVGVTLASTSSSSSAGAGVAIGVVLILLGVVSAFMVGPGLILAMLAGVRDKKMSFKEAWTTGRPLVWRYAGLSMLITLMAVGGIILLFVPYLFVMKRYLLAPYYLVDQNLSVGEALHRSAQASKLKGAMWGLIGIYFLVMVLSAFPLIGLFGTLISILYTCAPAVRYVQVRFVEGAATTAAPTVPQQPTGNVVSPAQ